MVVESTYFMYNENEKEEYRRLHIQDKLLADVIQENIPEDARSLLDIACGTGDWLINRAKMYPAIQYIGVDIQRKLLDYAKERAQAEGVSVEFLLMDALRPLDFPKDYFDVTRMRLGSSFVRTWEWHKLLEECKRITCPGGTVRIIEAEFLQTASPNLQQLVSWCMQAMFRSAHLFSEDSDGVTKKLPEIFQRFGYKDMKQTVYDLSFTRKDEAFVEDVRHFYREIIPFIRRWTRFSSDYEKVYQEALQEMKSERFAATWRFVAVEGKA